MTSLRIALFFSALLPTLAIAAERATDFPAALAQAKEHGDDIAVLFHGSDWCQPGLKYAASWKDEALLRSAGGDLILVEIDRRENPDAAAEALAKRNASCPVKPRSLPAIALFDREGRLVALREGTPELDAQGRPEPTIQRAVELRKKRDDAWKRAGSANGPDKARWLARGLDLLGLGAGPKDAYRPVIEEMKKADPDDQSGELARFTFPGRKLLETALDQAKAGKFAEADAELAKWIAQPKLAAGQKQEALAARFALYQRWPEKKAALAGVLKEIEHLDPKSELGEAAATYQGMLGKKAE